VDDAGRYADFHALRHSFITHLGRAGVHPKTHQELARHSTPTLTARYTHGFKGDDVAAINALPDLSRSSQQAAKATGTDDAKPLVKNLAENLAPKGGFESSFVGADRQVSQTDHSLDLPENIGENTVLYGKNEQPPNGLEPLTCGLQNRCSTD